MYTTLVAIQASPEIVWDLLTDAEGFTEWNSTLVSIEGDIVEGGEVELVAKIDPSRTFALDVSDVVEGQSMVWSDGNFIFKGTRTYTVTPTDEGCTFEMTEVYSGLFAKSISEQIPDMQPAFDAYGRDLKAAAEARTPQPEPEPMPDLEPDEEPSEAAVEVEGGASPEVAPE